MCVPGTNLKASHELDKQSTTELRLQTLVYPLLLQNEQLGNGKVRKTINTRGLLYLFFNPLNFKLSYFS